MNYASIATFLKVGKIRYFPQIVLRILLEQSIKAYVIAYIYLFIYLIIFPFYSSRRKRSSNNLVFTSDMVHILPGYPKTSPDDPFTTLIAFYLQLPQGFSNTVVNKNVLLDIIKSNVSSIEESLGAGTILIVKPLSSTEDDDKEEQDDDEDEKSIPISALISASLGGLFLVIVIVLLLSCKKSNR